MRRSVVPAAIAILLLAVGCGRANQEQSPGAAERYLDNVSAHERSDDRAAAAKGMDEISRSSGQPDETIGQAPIYSREPVAPRQQ